MTILNLPVSVLVISSLCCSDPCTLAIVSLVVAELLGVSDDVFKDMPNKGQMVLKGGFERQPLWMFGRTVLAIVIWFHVKYALDRVVVVNVP